MMVIVFFSGRLSNMKPKISRVKKRQETGVMAAMVY